MKTKLKLFAGCLMAVFFIPFLITLILSGVGLEQEKIGLALAEAFTGKGEGKATVTMSYSVGTEEMGMEEYIVGALVPAYNYCSNGEFLKTMAVMCRTYIKYCNAHGEKCMAEFYTDTDMEVMWGNGWQERKAAITLAVEQTAGEYMVCDGEVIYPYCHLLTSGYTRNLREGLNYLGEAAVTEDSLDEEYVSVKEFSNKEFCTLMEQSLSSLFIDENYPGNELQIVEKTEGGYVVLIQVGNLIVDGDTVAQILKLDSPSFVVTALTEGIRFTVKGKGTGYGLSISGARRKAVEGSSYKEILNFFYRNIQFKAV